MYSVSILYIPKKILNSKKSNILVLGTTSEGTSLNVEERKLVAETWLKFGKNK